MKALFVCHGNICRSPMAEFIFKALAQAKGKAVYAESAAVSTEEIGNPIYPPAQRSLRQHGIPFDDRIICMDASNLRLLKRIIPDDPEGKVHLMMSYTGIGRDVADPWYTGDFETTFQDLLEACEAMLALL